MTRQALEKLELQLEDLIKSSHRLALENTSLHKQANNLKLEHDKLLAKNTRSAIKVKQLIMQLQDHLICQTT